MRIGAIRSIPPSRNVDAQPAPSLVPPPGGDENNDRVGRGRLADVGATAHSARTRGNRDYPGTRRRNPPLAPGQKWNPASKIKMIPPKRTVQRPGVVYVLNALQKPEPRKVVLGITDGSATELVSGDVHRGDLLIIGDSTQGAQVSGAPAQQPSLFGGLGRGGGGGRGN